MYIQCFKVLPQYKMFQPNDLNFKGILSLLNYPLLLFIYTLQSLFKCTYWISWSVFSTFINSILIQLSFYSGQFFFDLRNCNISNKYAKDSSKINIFEPYIPILYFTLQLAHQYAWIWKYMMKFIRKKALSKRNRKHRYKNIEGKKPHIRSYTL